MDIYIYGYICFFYLSKHVFILGLIQSNIVLLVHSIASMAIIYMNYFPLGLLCIQIPIVWKVINLLVFQGR